MIRRLIAVLAVVWMTACGVPEGDTEVVDLESVPDDAPGDELDSATQDLFSRTPYYRWASRTDHLAPQYEQCSPALVKLLDYLKRRWGGSSLGCHGNRPVRAGSSMSTHAWGAALDYTSGSWGTNFSEVSGFLIAHSEELGINTLHDYRWVSGRGRMWKPVVGWARANVGGPGEWIHIEVRPGAFSDARTVEQKLAGVAQSAPPTAVTPTQVPAGTDFVFDASFYLRVNPDVAAKYGATNVAAAATHWNQYGKREGRTASPVFSAGHYLAVQPDVKAWASGSAPKAVEHWVTWGLGEGREGAPNFDAKYYLAHHPDVKAAMGASYRAAAWHYLAHGLREGRRASASFDPRAYLSANPDVARAYGSTNYRGALEHWLAYGRAEGRRAVP